MEQNTSTEESKLFKDSVLGKYIILIWNGALIFFLLDLLFGAITTIILYAVMNSILLFGQPWNIIPEGYLGKTTVAFCLLYTISIATVAWWRHFSLIMNHAKNVNILSNQGQKKDSDVNEAQ